MKLLVTVCILLLGVQKAFCQQLAAAGKRSTIYIVRHGEKQSGDDPDLTAEGKQRAGQLASVLKNKKIRRIYVSEFKRTQQTADSMRIQLGIDTVQYLADTSCTALFAAITRNNDWNSSILIVSHSNIMQKIIYKLGISDFPQANIPAAEFDNLYRVSQKKKQAVLLHQKYGQPSQPSASMQQATPATKQ
ncbi:MAG: hypothetical protein RL172_2293 [Bacteroidota bacterium]|jgi:phosphohistidine phosphatase SixA